MGMGGAIGAVGGDVSVGHVNPAGLSLLSENQYSITPYMRWASVRGTHYNEQRYNQESSLRLGNISGLVNLKDSYGNWNYINFGASWNNITDFKTTSVFEGVNPESSLLDYFFWSVVDQQGANLEGIDTDYPFDASLAWETFLLDTFNNFFFTANPMYGQVQSNVIEQSGRHSEMKFNLSVRCS